MGCVYKRNWWLNHVSQCYLTVIGHSTTVPRASFFAEGEEAVRTLQFVDALSIFIYLAIEKCYSMVRRMRSATSQSSIFTFSPFSVMVKD